MSESAYNQLRKAAKTLTKEYTKNLHLLRYSDRLLLVLHGESKHKYTKTKQSVTVFADVTAEFYNPLNGLEFTICTLSPTILNHDFLELRLAFEGTLISVKTDCAQYEFSASSSPESKQYELFCGLLQSQMCSDYAKITPKMYRHFGALLDTKDTRFYVHYYSVDDSHLWASDCKIAAKMHVDSVGKFLIPKKFGEIIVKISDKLSENRTVKTWKTVVSGQDYVFANPESSFDNIDVTVFVSTTDKLFPQIAPVFFINERDYINVKIKPLKKFLALVKEHKQHIVRFSAGRNDTTISAPRGSEILMLKNQFITDVLDEPMDFRVSVLDNALKFCDKSAETLRIAINDPKRPVNVHNCDNTLALQNLELAFVPERGV